MYSYVHTTKPALAVFKTVQQGLCLHSAYPQFWGIRQIWRKTAGEHAQVRSHAGCRLQTNLNCRMHGREERADGEVEGQAPEAEGRQGTMNTHLMCEWAQGFLENLG